MGSFGLQTKDLTEIINFEASLYDMLTIREIASSSFDLDAYNPVFDVIENTLLAAYVNFSEEPRLSVLKLPIPPIIS